MGPTKLLFVSADAALIEDVAWQVHEEGHDAKDYVEADSDREIGDGFVPETADWRGNVDSWSHRARGSQLQRNVEGVEVAACGFFNGNEFVEPVNVNFEHYFQDILHNSARCIERQPGITAA